MILNRLVKHYDRLAADGANATTLPRPGYSLQKISFCVILDRNGTLQGFESLLKAGRKRPIATPLLLPGQNKNGGSRVSPGFLWDNSAYLLGYRPAMIDAPEAMAMFTAFRDRHLKLAAEIDSPAFNGVCAFLRNWTPEQALQYSAELDPIILNFGVFRISGESSFVHDDRRIAAYWQTVAADEFERVAGSTSQRSLCLISGEETLGASVHMPKIKGVAGTPSTGAVLVSCSSKAYESFGKRMGANATVGHSSVFKYATALNYLLNRQDRRTQLGDATVVYWAQRPTYLEQVMHRALSFSPPTESNSSLERNRMGENLALFLAQLDNPSLNRDHDNRFYFLGLSPNAGRISVRFWIDISVGQLLENLKLHQRDMELIGTQSGDPPLTVVRIWEATGRARFIDDHFDGFDGDRAPAILSAGIVRAVFQGIDYPPLLLQLLLARIRSDGMISHTRAAVIKATLNRESRSQSIDQEMPSALDAAVTAPAYLLGRLFAVLEKIEVNAAGGELKMMLKDVYFGCASASPRSTFPTLLRRARYHLQRLELPQRNYYKGHLTNLNRLIGALPVYLSVRDQGCFVVGYFHQRAELFTASLPPDKQDE